MKNLISLAVVLAFAFGCKNERSKSISEDNQSEINLYEQENNISLASFNNLIVPLISSNDSSMFLFTVDSRENDTSWAIYVQEGEANLVKVNYHVSFPYQASNYSTSDLDSIRMAIYKGYSCIMPKSYWKRMLDSSGFDAYMPIHSEHKLDYLPPRSSYRSIYANSKLITDFDADRKFVLHMDSFLKEKLIREFFLKREGNPKYRLAR
jgi:hypothetical protein